MTSANEAVRHSKALLVNARADLERASELLALAGIFNGHLSEAIDAVTHLVEALPTNP